MIFSSDKQRNSHQLDMQWCVKFPNWNRLQQKNHISRTQITTSFLNMNWNIVKLVLKSSSYNINLPLYKESLSI